LFWHIVQKGASMKVNYLFSKIHINLQQTFSHLKDIQRLTYLISEN